LPLSICLIFSVFTSKPVFIVAYNTVCQIN
jgi:hypothetical protein